MKNTGNYNLKKPEGTDVVNIDDLNYNTDIIDAELKKLDTNKADKNDLKYVKSSNSATVVITQGANKEIIVSDREGVHVFLDVSHSEVINASINYLGKCGGGKIILGEGKYFIDKPIVLLQGSPPINIQGMGTATVLEIGDDKRENIFLLLNDYNKIQDIIIECNYMHKRSIFMLISGIYNTIENVKFFNFESQRPPIIQITNNYNKIINCDFEDCYFCINILNSSQDVTGNVIRDNIFTDNAGVNIGCNGYQNIINNNRMNNGYIGISLDSQKCIVTNNIIESGSTGISNHGSMNIITNNILSSNARAIVNDSSESIIENNIIE